MAYLTFLKYERQHQNYYDQIVCMLKEGTKVPFDHLHGYLAVMLGFDQNSRSDGHRLTIMIDGGDVLGYALYSETDFKQIFIKEDLRQRKYARDLYDHILDWYKKNDITEVELSVYNSNGAQGFWGSRATEVAQGLWMLNFD